MRQTPARAQCDEPPTYRLAVLVLVLRGGDQMLHTSLRSLVGLLDVPLHGICGRRGEGYMIPAWRSGDSARTEHAPLLVDLVSQVHEDLVAVLHVALDGDDVLLALLNHRLVELELCLLLLVPDEESPT